MMWPAPCPILLCALQIVSAGCLQAAALRWARIGEVSGGVEVKLSAFEPWRAAARNTPLPESSRLKTDGGRLETELDDGSVLRLAGSGVAELSDYTALSTGQKITLISLDLISTGPGRFYFTGRPQLKETLSLAMPGAQVTLIQRARIRSEITPGATEIAVLEGTVRFSTASAELELREGQMVRVGRTSAGRFQLFREIPPLPEDDWSQKRDRAQEAGVSVSHLPGLRFGTLDLDLSGKWLQTENHGTVWKPAAEDGWAPFQSGVWRWYGELGYTWVGSESWGWLPYHYGRWLQEASLGWVWVPGSSRIFEPGPVYWMRANGLALWGALAPGERWTAEMPSRQFARRNTAAGYFTPGRRLIDLAPPAAKPKDLLASAEFVVALPSPPFPPQGLEAKDPPLEAKWFNQLSLNSIPGWQPPFTVKESRRDTEPHPNPNPAPLPSKTPALIVDRPVFVQVAEPVEMYYPVPIYTGVIVLNPAIGDGRKPKKGSTESHASTPNIPEPPTTRPLPNEPFRATPPE